MKSCLLMVCALASLLLGVWGGEVEEKYRHKGSDTIYPWRDAVIPPIKVTEDDKDFRKQLIVVKSEKFLEGEGLYKLQGPGVDQEPKGMFEIDEKTGQILIKQPLDRETHQSFELKVSAVSPSGNVLERQIPIQIQVTDLNDNAPVFTQQVFTGSVQELSAPGTFVMQVSATDADEPGTFNRNLLFSIIGEESVPAKVLNKKMFTMAHMSGDITITDDGLDREVVRAFTLTLKVADLKGLGLSSEAVAIINVTDINDHAPEFSPTSYHMTVVENTLGDIGRVNVTDGDEPGTGNWEAKFSISDDPHGYFTVRTDAETNQGILSVVKPLDFETVTELNLTLRVENIKPLSSKAPTVPVSTATVIVTVVNDNEAPYFTEDPIKLVVPQNVLPGTSLKSNIAVNPENLGMWFEITEDPENWLDINKDTGEIVARGSFNRSSPHVQNQVYTAGVKLTDTSGTSSTATVQIILGANNFAPQLSPLSGFICKNGGLFSSGLVLTAVDEDLPPHAEPFSFETNEISMTTWNVTQVNDTHAALQPGVDLQSGVYQVTVMVSDSGTPTRHSSAQVNVTLCVCDSSGHCRSAVVLESGMGIGTIFGIIIIIIMVIIAVVSRQDHVQQGKDDNQGDGGENQIAINLNVLRSPNNAATVPSNAVPAPNNVTPATKNATLAPNSAVSTPNNATTATTSPNNATIAPNNATTSPNNATIAPNNATTSPNNATTAPNNATTSPNNATTSPNNATTAPNNATTAPNNAMTAPNNATTSPNNATIAPNNATTSPNNATTAPNNATTSPNNATTSPNNATTAPNNATTSPNNATTSPNNATTAPNNATTSPNNATTAPNNATTAPNNAMTAHNNVAPASNNTMTAPNNATPFPDSAAPVPDSLLCSHNTASPAPNNAAPPPDNLHPVCNDPQVSVPIGANDPTNLSGLTQPCGPPADLKSIEDLIILQLEAAEKDPNVPPHDVVQVYDYEEEGSVADSLSSIFSSSSDDQDYDDLNNWGPRFQMLADIYNLSEEDETNVLS